MATSRSAHADGTLTAKPSVTREAPTESVPMSGVPVAPPPPRFASRRELARHRLAQERGGLALVREGDALHATVVSCEVGALDATQPRGIPHDRRAHDDAGRRGRECPRQRTVVDRD